MALAVFLCTVYGKQGETVGEDKKLEMEVLKDIGIQRLVSCLAFMFHSKLSGC